MYTIDNLKPIDTYEGLRTTRVTYIIDHSSGKKLVLEYPEHAPAGWSVEQGRDEFFNPVVIDYCNHDDRAALATLLAKHFPA